MMFPTLRDLGIAQLENNAWGRSQLAHFQSREIAKLASERTSTPSAEEKHALGESPISQFSDAENLLEQVCTVVTAAALNAPTPTTKLTKAIDIDNMMTRAVNQVTGSNYTVNEHSSSSPARLLPDTTVQTPHTIACAAGTAPEAPPHADWKNYSNIGHMKREESASASRAS